MPATAELPKIKDLFKNDSTPKLFSESSQHTEEGGKFAAECETKINSIFVNAMMNGYKVREIAQILYSSVSLIEAKKSLEYSEDFNNNKRWKLEDSRRKERLKKINEMDGKN